MKNLKLILLILMISFVWGCEKWFDYRHDFIGEYQCSYQKILTIFGNGNYPNLIDTLIFTNDTILTVFKSDMRDEIEFLDWNFRVLEDGVVDSNYCVRGDCAEWGGAILEFNYDSVSLIGGCTFGHDQKFEYQVKGKKIQTR